MTISTVAYLGFNKHSPQSLERIALILNAILDLGTATPAQLIAATGIDKRAMTRYLAYLREDGRMVQLTPHSAPLGISATYTAGEGVAIEPESIQRAVGADDWQRGEHAYRSGLLAVFFPFAQG